MSIVYVSIANNVAKITWECKHNDIANEICELGDCWQFLLKLREGWVRYLVAAESGQSFRWLVDAGLTKKMIVDDLLCPTTAFG
jgi:hypothetical protein